MPAAAFAENEDIAQQLKALGNTYSVDYCPGKHICRDPRRDKIIAMLEALKGKEKSEACAVVKEVAHLTGERWNHILILDKGVEVMESYNGSLTQGCRDSIVSAYGKFLERQDKDGVAQKNSRLHGGHSISVWDFASDEEVAAYEKRFERMICSTPLKPGLKKWDYVVVPHWGREAAERRVQCVAE